MLCLHFFSHSIRLDIASKNNKYALEVEFIEEVCYWHHDHLKGLFQKSIYYSSCRLLQRF